MQTIVDSILENRDTASLFISLLYIITAIFTWDRVLRYAKTHGGIDIETLILSCSLATLWPLALPILLVLELLEHKPDINLRHKLANTKPNHPRIPDSSPTRAPYSLDTVALTSRVTTLEAEVANLRASLNEPQTTLPITDEPQTGYVAHDGVATDLYGHPVCVGINNHKLQTGVLIDDAHWRGWELPGDLSRSGIARITRNGTEVAWLWHGAWNIDDDNPYTDAKFSERGYTELSAVQVIKLHAGARAAGVIS